LQFLEEIEKAPTSEREREREREREADIGYYVFPDPNIRHAAVSLQLTTRCIQ